MFNNSWVKKMNDHFSIQQAYSFLFGMLGAMVAIIIIHLFSDKQEKIMTVNITAIVSSFIQHETEKHLPEPQLKKEVQAFGERLECTLKAYTKDNHILLLPSEAVIAGSSDVTTTIQAILQDK